MRRVRQTQFVLSFMDTAGVKPPQVHTDQMSEFSVSAHFYFIYMETWHRGGRSTSEKHVKKKAGCVLNSHRVSTRSSTWVWWSAWTGTGRPPERRRACWRWNHRRCFVPPGKLYTPTETPGGRRRRWPLSGPPQSADTEILLEFPPHWQHTSLCPGSWRCWVSERTYCLHHSINRPAQSCKGKLCNNWLPV